jgi:hypothetical protein
LVGLNDSHLGFPKVPEKNRGFAVRKIILAAALSACSLNAGASLVGDTVSSTHVFYNGNYEIDTVSVTNDSSDLMAGPDSSTSYTIDVNAENIYINVSGTWNSGHGFNGFKIFDLDDSSGLGLSAIDVDTDISNWTLDRLVFTHDQIWILLAGDGFGSLGGYSVEPFYIDLSLTFDAVVVPIPAAVWLFGSALVGLGWMRRKQTV